MNEHERLAFHQLVNKVKQHEQTITQLLQIIAATNRRVIDLINKQEKSNHQ